MRPAYSAIALSLCLAAACGGGDAASVHPDGGSPQSDAQVQAPGAGGTRASGAGGTRTAGSGGTAGRAGVESGGSSNGSGGAGSGGTAGSSGSTGTSPTIASCPILPSNHIFNTPIDKLPVHGQSAAFMTTIGSSKIHLDLGQSVNMAAGDYYGIPYNVVHGNGLAWASVKYTSMDTSDMTWDPKAESDCASGSAHSVVSPCTTAAAPAPLLPIPSGVLVEGGVFPDVANQGYGDHHILLLDADTCRLWEAYHAYTGTGGVWDIFGSATFDLHSNALRPAGWSSVDAAGFPVLPLLLRADEASSGTIRHALRFTIDSHAIRNEYVWPARHLTDNGTLDARLPPMGQLFRVKSSYVIPATFSVQSKAILKALQTYGVYLADGGSNLYVQGEPSASWSDTIFDEVQTVTSADFEAVDLGPIQARAGFDANSAAVPP